MYKHLAHKGTSSKFSVEQLSEILQGYLGVVRHYGSFLLKCLMPY